MVLSRSQKEQVAIELAEALRNAPASAVLSFRRLTVADSSNLRRALRGSGGRMRVVKKRVFARVGQSLGLPSTSGVEGSVAVAWSTDVIAPAKILYAYAKGRDDARVECGLLNGAALSSADVAALATLPGLSELRASLVGTLAGPLRSFVGVLSGTIRGLPSALQAIAKERGEKTEAVA